MVDNILFMHGWSYDKDFFKLVADVLGKNSYFYNRGYYDYKEVPELPKDESNIAITHSMGIYFLLEDYKMDDFDKIIIINGFSCFLRAVPRKQLLEMKKNLLRNFSSTIRHFSMGAGDLNRKIPKKEDCEVADLIRDINLLIEGNIYTRLSPFRKRIYHIHSDNDNIIAHYKAAIPFEKQHIINNQPHIYPIHKHDETLRHIKELL